MMCQLETLHNAGCRIGGNFSMDSMSFNFRPSINIKTSVLVDSGDGTSSKPYTLKLS